MTEDDRVAIVSLVLDVYDATPDILWAKNVSVDDWAIEYLPVVCEGRLRGGYSTRRCEPRRAAASAARASDLT